MKGYLGVAAVLLSLLFCRVEALKAEDVRSQAAQICSVPASGSFEGDLEAVSVWLERSRAINANDGSWHSEMARGSLKFAAALQGRPLSDDAIQRMSDLLAVRFAELVIRHRAIPALEVIIALEVEVIASELKLGTWNWPYALTDSLPIRFGGFGRDLVQIPGSGFEYAKNVLFATMQFAAGLKRYVFRASALDFLPLWNYAQAAHRYVSDQLYRVVRWLSVDDEIPQAPEMAQSNPSCALLDRKNKKVYTLNLPSDQCKKIEYVDGAIIDIRLSHPEGQVVSSAWRGKKLLLQIHYDTPYTDVARALREKYQTSDFHVGRTPQHGDFVFLANDREPVTVKERGRTWVARRMHHDVLLSYQYATGQFNHQQIDDFVTFFATRTINKKEQ